MESTDDVSRKRARLRRRPPGHHRRFDALSRLASALYERFEKEGEMDDLNEAIDLSRAALELRPVEHNKYGRSISLNELAICLSVRYDNQGEEDDLEEAITLGRGALEFCPLEHPDRSVYLYSLANHLWKKFQKQTVMHDLDEAIELLCAALELRPSGHPNRSPSLHSLARCLYDKQMVAIDFKEATAQGRATGHPDRGAVHLDEAIALQQEAVQLLKPGDPFYDSFRRSLTFYLQMKIGSQIPMPSLDAPSAAKFDITQIIRNVVFETLKATPPRLLHTFTGILCNRDAQVSHFMGSQQCNQLLSSCATCDADQRMELIHTEVSRYFRFVMLSHHWGEGEPLLRNIEGRPIYNMPSKGGLRKLQAFCTIALGWDYLWAWSDTCCIDKDSSAELQEAIGSMFAWYRRSALTIVYLADVPATSSFESSEWFRRGWTLQELLAPRCVLFYTQTWLLYKNLTSSNHKTEVVVLEELERATGIESRFLTNFSPSMDDARSRLQWASSRRTTRPEDIAYSLFGIFNLHLPVLYGESAENTLGRLLAEIISQSGDISILDWVGEASPYHSCFPAYVTSYQTVPLLPPRPNVEGHALVVSERPTSSAALQALYRALARAPLPRFVTRRLTLPCIAHCVTAVQLIGSSPHAPSYTYEIQASGLRPLEITLPNELENGALQLVRPWHSKLLGSTELYATTEEHILFTLGRPFDALLLIELPHDEYKRIASSTSIIAHPLGSANIRRSEVRIFDIV
ncbi:hypothetical protein BKA82DRAFT_4347943 [Pisolithus tinctorius]|nr:hypothetical protein BKA82DRAFT_4347943 [Pisolithus tinctorius]